MKNSTNNQPLTENRNCDFQKSDPTPQMRISNKDKSVIVLDVGVGEGEQIVRLGARISVFQEPGHV